MARIDKAPAGGKFRAVTSSSLDGVTGLWGDSDLLCVTLDSAGYLDLATVGDCVGVIWTPEGKLDADASNYKQAVGGRAYTVLKFAELTEMQTGSGLAAGDQIWSIAGGDVDTVGTAAGGYVWVGQLDATGERMVLDVNGKPVA